MSASSKIKPIYVISSSEYYNNKGRYKITFSPNKGEVNLRNLSTDEVTRMSKNDPRAISGEYVSIWTGKHHSDETKHKMSISHIGKGGSKGQKWVTNGYTTIRVRKDQFQFYLDNGYRPERK